MQWDLIQMVGFICMTPASWASDTVLHERWGAYVNNQSTFHWPHHFISGTRATYDLPSNNLSNLSQHQRNLIGAWTSPPETLMNDKKSEQTEN
mmetsp:Transcript_9186/g.11569  ORF Transcript_9186/g.11569 Transcript_9186/m.11569 type:complete len:93 (+) Transcript_9186:789-1067(+)